MENEISLLYSEESATELYPEPGKSSSQGNILFI